MMADRLQDSDAGGYHVLLNPLLTASAGPAGAAPAAASMPDVSTRCPATACRQGWLCGLVALQSALLVFTTSLLVLRGCLLSTVHAPDVRFDQPIFLSECLHPMGGGAVQAGGGFKPLNDSVVSDECASEMQVYFSRQEGQYWVDVARVAESARQYFDQLAAQEPPTPKKLIIFDIDETTLSNAEEWQAALALQQRRTAPLAGHAGAMHQSRPGGSHDDPPQDPQVGRGNLQRSQPRQQSRSGGLAASVGGRGVRLTKAQAGLAERPPLAPMLALYQYLFASGYSVAFITGRKEAQRNSTAANLEAAGYGRQCRKGELFGPRSQGLEAEGWQGRRPMAACYAALHLRNMDDDRFASVYKPERRGALEAAGFVIYGNFGDQFSDLDGLFGAPHSFKLPNPAYLIL